MQYVVLVLEVLALIIISALCSGLNISFMSLAPRDLKHKARLGNKDAQRILPLRQKSHLTLAAILYTNIGAAMATGLVINQYTGGLVAGFVSTIVLVIFGEILPQAYFSRAALAMCGRFAPFLNLIIVLTYPFSKPTALLLDKILPGHEHPLRSRHELGLLIEEYEIAESSELDDDEVEIIQSALQLSEKRIEQIMQPIKDVFWLRDDAVLDAKTIDLIKAKGYTRIPVLNKEKTMCFGVLLTKDMLDIDFDEHPQPVRSFKLHRTKLVGSRTALDTMLRRFFTLRTHLVPVEKNDKIVGIVTVEDLIEEIIGHEIEDETDHALNRD